VNARRNNFAVIAYLMIIYRFITLGNVDKLKLSCYNHAGDKEERKNSNYC
jgi:hypothetical protein